MSSSFDHTKIRHLACSFDEDFCGFTYFGEHTSLRWKRIPKPSVTKAIGLYTRNVIGTTAGCTQCQLVKNYAEPYDYKHTKATWFIDDNYTIYDFEGTIDFEEKYISSAIVTAVWRFEIPSGGLEFNCSNIHNAGVASIIIHALNDTGGVIEHYNYINDSIYAEGNIIIVELILYRVKESVMSCQYKQVPTSGSEYTVALVYDGELSENTYSSQMISQAITTDTHKCMHFTYIKQQSTFTVSRNDSDGHSEILFQDVAKTYGDTWKTITVPLRPKAGQTFITFHSHKSTYGYVEFPVFVDDVSIDDCDESAFPLPVTEIMDQQNTRVMDNYYLAATPGGESSHDITQLYIHQEDVEEFLIHSFPKNIDAFLSESAQNLEDLVVTCEWKGHTCNNSHWTELMTDMGQCFTFNADPENILETSNTGLANGLQLTMYVEEQEYIEHVGSNSGVKIHVHDQREVPIMKSRGYAVSPGTNTLFNLKYNTNEFLKPDYGTCGTSDLDLFPGVTYTTSHCLIQCETLRMLAKCNCTLPHMPAEADMKMCTLDDYLNCVIVNSATNVDIPCECPDACNQVQYEAELSYSSSSLDADTLLGNKTQTIEKMYSDSLNLRERLRNGTYLDFLLSVQSNIDDISYLDYFRNTDPGYVISQVIAATDIIAQQARDDVNGTNGGITLQFNKTVIFSPETVFSEVGLQHSFNLLMDQYIADYLIKQDLVNTFLDGPYESSLRYITETVEVIRMVELQKGTNTALYDMMNSLEELLSSVYMGILKTYEKQGTYSTEDISQLAMLHVFREPRIDVKSLIYSWKYSHDDVYAVIGDYVKRYLTQNVKKEKYRSAYQNLLLDLKTLLDNHVTENSRLENTLLKSVANFQYLLEQFQEKIYLDSLFMRKNLVQVGIYFEEVKESKTKQNIAYSIGDFFSDLGGFLGLLLGASVVTLFEILDLIFYKIFEFNDKMTKEEKNGIEDKDIEEPHGKGALDVHVSVIDQEKAFDNI